MSDWEPKHSKDADQIEKDVTRTMYSFDNMKKTPEVIRAQK